MIAVDSFQTPILGYVVTTYRYHDNRNRIVDLYLTTIRSLVPGTAHEIFQDFKKTSMSMSSSILLHDEAVGLVERCLTLG